MESEKNDSRRKPSSWPLVFASIAMSVVTFSLFALYGTIHWGIIPQTIRLQRAVSEIRSVPSEIPNPIAFDKKGKSRFDDMDKQIQAIKKTGESLMRVAHIYPITGLTSLIFAIMSFFRRPRWAAFIALPFGLLAALVVGIMM